MAVTASGMFLPTFVDILDATQLAVNTGSDTFTVAMITNSATPTFATHASGTSKVDAADSSWTTSTSGSARAAGVYDDTRTNDPLVCLVNFGADYSSANGTFTITWNASGIWTLDLTP